VPRLGAAAAQVCRDARSRPVCAGRGARQRAATGLALPRACRNLPSSRRISTRIWIFIQS